MENGPLQAHVWPYNHDINDSTLGCAQIPAEIYHTAELGFTETGEAVLRLTGHPPGRS